MLKETTRQAKCTGGADELSPTGRRMNAQALGEFLGWKTQTVRRRVSDGLSMPPSIKVGNRRWWIESDVIEWENAHRENTSVLS